MLQAGRKPPRKDAVTLRQLLNSFLTSKQRLLESGEIVKRTFDEYHRICEYLTKQLPLSIAVEDITPAEFDLIRTELSSRCGPVRLGNEVQRIRVVFNYAYNAEFLFLLGLDAAFLVLPGAPCGW